MDLLYLFIAAVSAFFVVLVAALVVVFAIKFRRRHPDDVGADIHGSLALELTWTIIPFVLAMVMFVWGAELFFRLARPPRGLDGDLRRRQAVDVEGAASRRRARNQRTARADRPQRRG